MHLPLFDAAVCAGAKGITFNPCNVFMFNVDAWKPGGKKICWVPCWRTVIVLDAAVGGCARKLWDVKRTVCPPAVTAPCDVRITFCH